MRVEQRARRPSLCTIIWSSGQLRFPRQRRRMSNMEALARKPLSPAFRMALLAGVKDSVRLHLRYGGDVNAADDKGRSPLILATSRGHLELCKLLLGEGADPAIRDHA